MSAATGAPGGGMWWSARTARWTIVAVHLVILAIPPTITSFGITDQPGSGPVVIAMPLGLAVLALQLRQSFAIARGQRPRGALWTLLALAALVYLPLPWFGGHWAAMQACLMASAPVVLRGWPLVVALATPILASDLAVVWTLPGQQKVVRSDRVAAPAEIGGLTGVAREALHGVRAVARDEHSVSLRTESNGAAALLSAAGMDARIDLDLPDLPPPVETMLGWAVREGVTNVLRHSEATTCSISAGTRDGTVRLEIVNDGPRTPAGEGSGLAGLTERARALSGSVSAGRTGDGRFRLRVEVPVGHSAFPSTDADALVDR